MAVFTPKSDDTLAAATVEVAQVKSSGYLVHYGFGGQALAFCLADAQARGGRVVVTRPVGSTDWQIVDQADAPSADTLPDGISADDFQ